MKYIIDYDKLQSMFDWEFEEDAQDCIDEINDIIRKANNGTIWDNRDDVEVFLYFWEANYIKLKKLR